MHQYVAPILPASETVGVQGVRLQALQAKPLHGRRRLGLDGEDLHHNGLPVRTDKLPHGFPVRLRRADAVERAVVEDRRQLLVQPDLLPHLLQFPFRQFVQIQFIAKLPRHGGIAPGVERGNPACLMVGAGGDMRAHDGEGIAVAGTRLDILPLHCVGVVAEPDLIKIAQHAQIEPASAAGAALHENVREPLLQGSKDPVKADHVPVRHLPLPVRWKRSGADFRHVPVHVPFYVFHRHPGKQT